MTAAPVKQLVGRFKSFIYSNFICRHRLISWVRNTHGDEINHCGGKRTWFHCDSCSKFILHQDYITKNMAISIYQEPQPYVACPQCGAGIARNWLKCRDPDWKYCADCVGRVLPPNPEGSKL